MNNLEMVDYINVVAKFSDKAKSIAELDCCLDLIEKLITLAPKKYHSLYKAVYCHVNSLIAQRMLDSMNVDNESGVYVIEFSDGFVKIGMKMTNFNKRLRTIANQTAASVIRYEFIPCNHPSQIESSLHHYFSYARSNGEFFNIDYDECLYIANMFAKRH